MNSEVILSSLRSLHEHRQKVYAILFLLWIPALAGSISIVAAQPEVVRVWHEIISTPEILEILELLMYAGWPVALIAALTTAMILTDTQYDRVMQLQQSSTAQTPAAQPNRTLVPSHSPIATKWALRLKVENTVA